MEIINFYNFRHMRQGSDFRFEGHRHGRYEANIILNGTIELTCNENIYTVPKNSFAVWKSGVFHMSRVVSEEGAELIAMEFDPADDGFPSNESAVFKLDETDMMLVELMEASEGEAVKKLTEAFFIRLSRRESNIELSERGLSGVYRRAVGFMADNLDKDIKVASVAKHCGVCTTTLKKAFSDYAGKGVKAYFNGMKIHRAKEMLREGMGVAETSYTLGFSSPAYFSQCFKRGAGVSPRKIKSE